MPDGGVLRILDANLNRAREALRVMEDYARFVLDHEGLCRAVKDLRHGLRAAAEGFSADAVLWRDTAADVGTGIKTADELVREDPGAVVIAAGKRLGEALRVIEEYLKTFDLPAASRAEQLRYWFYEVEQMLVRTVRPPGAFTRVRLYVLVTEKVCRRPWLEAAEQAILGGADCLQLREKDLGGAELLRRARQMAGLCRRHGVLSIINDRPDIVELSGADGVHVGQGDLPAEEARKVVGRGKIVGVSTHSIEQARQAVARGADYIGVGPVYRSDTKPREFVAGLEYARQAAREIRIPAVAIAGITVENVGEAMLTGVSAAAVTAAVMGAEDVRSAAAALKQKILAALSGTRPPAG